MPTMNSLTCCDCNRPMAKSAGSSAQGLAKCLSCRRDRPSKVTVPGRPWGGRTRPCSVCGDPRPFTHTSRPDIICRACQRKAHGLAADERVTAKREAARRPKAPCVRCGSAVPGGRRWKYCSDECHRKVRNSRGNGAVAKASATKRGYGVEHQRLRASLLPLAYGTTCPLCGGLMREGDKLHLDHTEDRTGYRGIVHASCNVRDGAKRGGAATREKRLAEGWRHGTSSGTRRRSTASPT